uniref:guanylate cyclase n=1 Tax=Chelonoidis abingdonii TaxID=106734 RepID=A0A8C0GVM1_CHEAB
MQLNGPGISGGQRGEGFYQPEAGEPGPASHEVFLLRLSNHPRWGRQLPQAPLLWLLLLGWPAWVQPATFKVGVMGPWTCDPMFAQALPEVAAQLAVGRLNRDPTMNQGYWFDYVLLNEECQTSQALVALVNAERYASGFVGPLNPGVCGAAGLLGRAWNKPIFSWACLNGDAAVERWGTFARPLPRASSVLYAVLKFFRWAHVAVVTSRQELWVEVGQGLASSLREFGLPVGVVTTMEPGTDGAWNALRKVQRADNIRVVVMCMHSVLLGGEEQRLLLEKAEDLRMTDGTFVFIPYDALTYSLPYRRTPYPVLDNNTKLRLAYDAVLTITIDAPERGFREAFQDAQQARELPAHLDPMQVHPLFGTIYNSIYYLAKAVERTRQAGRWVMGSSVAEHARDFQLDGFCQPLAADEDGDPLVTYIILDTDGKGNRLWPTYSVAMGPEGLRYVGHAIHWPHSASPSTDSSCWFDPMSVCSGGEHSLFILLLFILVSIGGKVQCPPYTLGHCAPCLCASTLCRRRILLAQLMKGPNKIILTMDDLTFIHTQSSNKVRGRSGGQRTVGGGNPTGAKGGDWVWLKKFPGDKHRDHSLPGHWMSLLLRRNVNLFLGFFYDCGVFAIVSEHCSRGSLEDLIRNEDMKLDWMFKSSLLIDLIKGMKYLHHRDVVHGRLKSRNCVVDGRFVLKVTDHGFNELLEAQKIPHDPPRPEGDRFWTAPELLRDPTLERKGTFRGDIYSISIIMQEVICRSAPYCMLDMPADGTAGERDCAPISSSSCLPTLLGPLTPNLQPLLAQP